MKYVLKYDSSSQISLSDSHKCPGVVLCGTSWDNYRMNSCDYGEDTEYCMNMDDSGNIRTAHIHNVGDICYWNGTGLDYVPYTSWSSSLGQALAVCVVPTSHVISWGGGDFRARFVSVKGVNVDGSESSSNISMVWGPSIDTTLTNYTRVPTWDNTIGGSVGTNTAGNISSDKFTGTTNVIDTSTKYYSTSTNNMIPSPYAADGSFYPDYARVISGNNALTDFNGLSNTNTLAGLGSSYAAATACHLYSTNGITAGNWYLPACGELAYIMLRYNVINATLTACNGVLLGSNYGYWSSTEYGSDRTYNVTTSNGYVYYFSKNDYRYTRPFTALN